MCGPAMAAAMVASAAMAVGSSMAAKSADNAVQSAQDHAINKSRARDQALAAEARGIFSKSLDRSGKPATDARMNEAVTNRSQAYGKAISAPTGDVLPGETPSVISNEAARAVGSADRSVAQQAASRAKLDAFGDTTLGDQINNSQGNNLLSMLGNFRAGNSAILPLALQAAQRKGAGKRTLSDLLRVGSQVVGAAGGAMGGGMAGAATAAIPTVIGSNAARRGF